MGAWGTAIYSNDTFVDIYGDFFDLYNEGLCVKEVSAKLIADNSETINDAEERNNFWFALAKAQWECKELDGEVFRRVRQIIADGSDLEVWGQLGATDKDIKKRSAALDKFLADLEKERPKPKARKKKVIRQPVFLKGDCITFKLETGNYGGAVVLEAVYDTEFGYNLIATTRINQPHKPKVEEFEKAEVLIINFGSWDDSICVRWIMPTKFKEVSHLFEKVGSLKVGIAYDSKHSNFGYSSSLVGNLLDIPNLQFASEETKQKPGLKNTVKDFISNS
ncbi:hypothetical protein [Rufibacter sp. XAAS-G3-1]|uniref:hypothetical protein n=1 Tax=Rufibacter sp. XAAS-G3-1 TaxID=2729134 RepID=UPI0015E79DD7|nr:hypothetical protein [Rufibacter sp. XAAS-G3-1]